MDIKLCGDYHTHSNFSGDSNSELEDNVKRAIELGLTELGITDHGIKHLANGVSKKNFFKQVELVKELQAKYPQIKLLQSIEANILNFKGDLDLDSDILPHLDYIMMGYHLTSKPTSVVSFFSYNVFQMQKVFKPSKSRIEKNTMAYMRCIERYPLSFVNHLNYKMQVDVKPISKLCKEKGTLIELNGKRVLFDESEIYDLLESGVEFIVNSDAHNVDRIGDITIPMKFIEKYEIPFDRIKNINNLPLLKRL